MTLTDGAELYICLILTIEFIYDYWYNSRENRIKRRKNAAKKETKEEKMDKQGLRSRESPILQETGREVRDLRETTIPVQEKTMPRPQS